MASAGSGAASGMLPIYMRLDMYRQCMSHYMYMSSDMDNSVAQSAADTKGLLMTTIDNTPDEPHDEGSHPTDRRPLGMWLRVVDRLISREFAAAFDGESVSRRDWMVLNAVAGTVDAEGLADRLAHGGKHVRRLADRGWITRDDDGAWALTETGTAAFGRLSEKVGAVRAKVAGTLPDDDFAQLKASLEAMARGMGWDETQPMPRGRGPRGRFAGRRGHRHDEDEFGEHGYGPHHGFGEHGFDPRARFGEHGFDPRVECEHGFGPGRRGFGPGHHAHLREEFERRHHGRAHKGDPRRAEHAYERGFAAGFDAAHTWGAASTPTDD